jgi:hypothetical protein
MKIVLGNMWDTAAVAMEDVDVIGNFAILVFGRQRNVAMREIQHLGNSKQFVDRQL